MAAIVAASHVNSLAALMIEKRLDRKKKTVWADRRKRPFSYWVEGIKKATGLSGTKVSKTMKFDAGLALSTWRGDPTLPNPGVINNHITTEFEYANFFQAFAIVHDYYKQHGFTILPNDRGQSLGSRARKMSGSEYEQLKNKLNEDMDSFEDSWERRMDLALHKQGTLSSDLVGLNGLLPIGMQGLFGGHYREREPLVQHVVRAGSGAGVPVGNDMLGGSGTYGTGGTLIETIEDVLRTLKANVAMSEMTSGRWVGFAGVGFIKAVKAEYRRLGIQYNRQASGGGKVDLLLMDEDIEIGGMPIIWDPTLDQMDSVASSERGIGLSAGTVSFSGGAGSGAQAVVYTTAAGAIDKIVLLNRGSGYTSAPTVAVAGLGSPSGAATFQAYFYGTGSAATGKIVVDADDSRIGQLAYVAVTGGGAGYTAGSVLNFSDRLYLMYEPAWEPLYQDGLDKHMSIPADAARSRKTEIQCDATRFLVCGLPRVNGIIHAASV